MALSVTRPTQHPKSRTYRLRLAIPVELRETAKGLYGVQREFIANLGTADKHEAWAKTGEALAGLQEKLAAVRAAAAGQIPRLTTRQIAALEGQFYKQQLALWEDNPGRAHRWRDQRGHLEDCLEVSGDPADRSTWKQEPVMGPDDLEEARATIAGAKLVAGPEDVHKLAMTLWGAKWDLATVLERRARGDYSPDTNLARFPSMPSPATPQAPGGLTLDSLIEGWARDHGWSIAARPMPRALYDRVRTLERLAKFLGHRSAEAVTKADALRWKEAMQTAGAKVPTVRNDLSEMSAIWKGAIRQGKLPGPSNPFEGVSPPKPKRAKSGRRPYTNQEAAMILNAAREQSGLMRWLPWVCALTGARLAEVCQGVREDVAQIEGVWVLRIHDTGAIDEEGVRSLKNQASERDVPLHPALIAEGFLAYVLALPARSPLFPDATLDKTFGLRSTNAGKHLSRWIRADLKLTDTAISPAHSWRHWFIDACRGAKVPKDIRSAITGHSEGGDESANYGKGMGSFIQVLAEAMATVRLPSGVSILK